MKTKFLPALLLVLMSPGIVSAKHLHPERTYQEQWCSEAHGVTEYRLPDRTRVDCLTATHAIEFDFASKWAESVGQALHYGLQTHKTPGVVLILEMPSDKRYLDRLQPIAEQHGITLWTIRAY